MTPRQFLELMRALHVDLERAANGEPIRMPRERAALTIEALLAADAGALRLTGGAR